MSQWDKLADEWDVQRKEASGALAFFLSCANGRVLDAGCGNGRNTFVIAKTASHVTALDSSENMLYKAKDNVAGVKNVDAVLGFLETLPFDDESFDAIFCLASLHHVKPKDLKKTMAGFFRILKKGGFLCVSVWNRDQPRFAGKKKELNVPWRKNPRYYHLMSLAELKALAIGTGFIIVDAFLETRGRKVSSSGQNACAIAQKR